jgi:hypothetical protein
MTDPGDQEDRALQARLRGLREDPPGGLEFQAALHRKLVAAGEPEGASLWERLRRRGPVLWPALGVAAGLAVFLIFSSRGQPVAPVAQAPAAEELPEASAVVPASKVALIKLNFTAEVAVESADFEVTLPAGLSFWADGEELPIRSFQWTQALDAGNNEVPIAVRGKQPGRYRLEAVARVGEQLLRHEVVIEVSEG